MTAAAAPTPAAAEDMPAAAAEHMAEQYLNQLTLLMLVLLLATC
jgi:hypothetical protein